MEPTTSIEPAWIAPPRRALPWFRLGVAGALIAGCAWRGLGLHCGFLPDVPEILTLLALLATQGATALASFGTSLLACARRDWRRARDEGIVGVLMLLAIPVGIVALLSTAPECQCQDDGC